MALARPRQAALPAAHRRSRPVGVAGEAKADVSHIYVVHAAIPRPGKYWALAKPVGGRPISGLGDLFVRRRTFSPAIGSRAYPSRTPTLRSAHGDASLVTTRTPPTAPLLRYSIAESIAAHKPFVVVFASTRSSARAEPAGLSWMWSGPFGKEIRAERHTLHSRRDLQGQRSSERIQPLGTRVAPSDRTVGLPRRTRREDQVEIRGIGVADELIAAVRKYLAYE